MALGLITLAALLIPAAGAWAGVIAPEAGGSPNADGIRSLYLIILGVAVVIFVGVEGLLFYTLFKYRARKGAVAVQIHGNTRLEIGWTVGATAILVVLAVVTFVKLDDIRNPPLSGADGAPVTKNGSFIAAGPEKRLPPDGKSLNIDVNGQQYVWRFTYADNDKVNLNDVFAYQEMVVPTDTTVTLDIRAQDVAHSWWIPKLGGKFDAIPGLTNHTWFKIHKPGIYTGLCAELCGRNHANMTARVHAVSPTEFEAWYADQKAAIHTADLAAAKTRKAQEATAAERAAAADGAAKPPAALSGKAALLAQGKKIFTGGTATAGACGTCHVLKAAGAVGVVGPSLDAELGSDPAAAIKQSIVNPNKEIAKGFQAGIMPQDYGKTLTSKELDALVAFIFDSTHGK